MQYICNTYAIHINKIEIFIMLQYVIIWPLVYSNFFALRMAASTSISTSFLSTSVPETKDPIINQIIGSHGKSFVSSDILITRLQCIKVFTYFPTALLNIVAEYLRPCTIILGKYSCDKVIISTNLIQFTSYEAHISSTHGMEKLVIRKQATIININGTIYSFGGNVSSEDPSTCFDYYDSKEEKWKSLEPMITARNNPSCRIRFKNICIWGLSWI